ncbi:MAG: tRNA (adenosine(37)-N6)-threonylcarbamoyltransferase complex ATPase subunit type 1 TsaE [Lachnospiraceae bacterium]|jgi:tRNA threonylcarbamoyladenosine biosynthesis protein TsaE|nr:tRNA (adenosine(37)-N6)-threonylcarbamoyltransferase complex ATPase subunit type 1 TsaE [Lachnospiraceae bacterium]
MGAGTNITEYESFSEDETFGIGKEYGKKARPGSVFSLEGDLGVGKTVFAKGFAEGLGITETVNSPTFTIMKVYEGGRLDLYHYDAYRIEDPSEMEEIGYTDYFYGEGTCLIEWACNIEEYLPEHFTKISIEKDPEKGFDYRRITVSEI